MKCMNCKIEKKCYMINVSLIYKFMDWFNVVGCVKVDNFDICMI